MKYIKLFEAFGSKTISAIEKFLKLLDKEDADNFVDILKSVSEKTDIPLSNFKGEYVKALTAVKMNVENEQLIKFWFSIENGFVGMTTTKSFSPEQLSFRKFQHEEDWMKTAFIQNFILNNLIVNEYLREGNWTKKRYEEIIESQFSLVINITELSKGLKDLKNKRKENKKDALAFYSDDYIRLKNQQRRDDILQQRRGLNKWDVRDKIYAIIKRYKCYDPMDLVDVCHELYFRRKISMEMFDAIMDDLEEHYGKLSGGYGGGWRKRGYEYDDYI